MFQTLGLKHGEVCCAQCVPFKSDSWRQIPDPQRSMDFSKDLWRSIVKRRFSARLIVCKGFPTVPMMKQILESLPNRPPERKAGPAGWGRVKWREDTAWNELTGQKVNIIGIPHLSRYKLFTAQGTRKGSEELGDRLETLVRAALAAS